jgi:DNA-binding transcriptional LysR family regulator
MFHSTFRQLEVFVAVVDEGSFASGAERLAISQPAISNHIRALESQVGCQLLDRRRGTTCDLTIAGRQLYEEATILLAQVDRLEQRLQHIRAREQKRELTIMASFYVIKQWVQPLVPEFLASQQGIVPVVRTGSFEETVAGLRGGCVDLGYMVCQGPIVDLESDIIRTEQGSLYVAQGHPLADRASVAADDVRRHPFIMPVNGSHLAALVRRNLGSIGISGFPVALQAEYSDVMEMTASQGVGIVCMFDGAALPHVQSGRLRRLPIEIPPLEIRRAYGTRRGARVPAQRLAQFIEAAMAQAPEASARLTSAA